VMHPGQVEPNELEIAILRHLARQVVGLSPLIPHLHVLSREFTGVGSYTNFRCEGVADELGDRKIGLEAAISMPNVPMGLGSVLHCEKGKPQCLEIYSYDPEGWDGVFEGFSIVSSRGAA
jgi:hypothetical protein